MKSRDLPADAWVRLELHNEWGAYYWGFAVHEPVRLPARVRVRWPSGDETIERVEKRRSFAYHLNDMGHESVVRSEVEVLVIEERGAELELMLDRVEVRADG